MSAVVFGSPPHVGHVRVLMPLAKRLVESGLAVIWAISGDATEPASAWRGPLSELGVHFIDVDAVVTFDPNAAEADAPPGELNLLRRVTARANGVAEAAAEAIRIAVAGRPILAGVYDYFALWSYVAMRRLDVARIHAVVSGFPAVLDSSDPGAYSEDPIYRRELDKLRASGFGCLDELRCGLIPNDPALDVVSFSSRHLCHDAPDFVRLLGVPCDVLPRASDIENAPEAHQALVRRLRDARAGGARIVLLSMGTLVVRMAMKVGPSRVAFLKHLYTTLAAAALRAGAVVVASTTDASAADLGVDEAALGPAARDRVIAMPFVPQPLLFAHGLVDAMLTHGGANTFHEAVMAGVPLLVCPAFGDQASVASTAADLGVGVSVESPMYPSLRGALPIARVADETLPEMLAAGTSRWKATVTRLAEQLKDEDGLRAAVAVVLGS